MTDPPSSPVGPFLVLQVLAPLRLPLAIHGAQRLLLRAIPKDKFTRFDSVDDAEHAIERTIRLLTQLVPDSAPLREHYAIVPVRTWLDGEEFRTRKRVGRSPAPPEEDA